MIKPIAQDALFRAIEELSSERGAAELPPELAGRPAFLAGLADDEELARKLVELFVQQTPTVQTCPASQQVLLQQVFEQQLVLKAQGRPAYLQRA